jgi:hypothetical protein
MQVSILNLAQVSAAWNNEVEAYMVVLPICLLHWTKMELHMVLTNLSDPRLTYV